MMSDLDQVCATYKYPLTVKIGKYWFPVFALLLFIGGMYVLFHSWFGLFLVLISIWLIFLSTYALFMLSTIIVNNSGIGARNLGRLLKHIRWRHVTKIVKFRRWNLASRTYGDVYTVFDGDFGFLRKRLVNCGGPILFTGQIDGVRPLLERINSYARQYHFSLFVVDEEAFWKKREFCGRKSRTTKMELASSRSRSILAPARRMSSCTIPGEYHNHHLCLDRRPTACRRRPMLVESICMPM